MITQWFLNLVAVIMGPVFSVLPTVDLSQLTSVVQNGAATAGGLAGQFNGVFPVTAVLNLFAWLSLAIEGAVVLYVVGNWVYRHIPQIAGFGPGSG